MQSVSKYPLIVTFHLLSADSLNLGQPQNGIFGKGLTPGFLRLITERKRRFYAIIYNIKCTLPQNTKVYHTFSNHNIPNFTVLLYRIPYLNCIKLYIPSQKYRAILYHTRPNRTKHTFFRLLFNAIINCTIP